MLIQTYGGELIIAKQERENELTTIVNEFCGYNGYAPLRVNLKSNGNSKNAEIELWKNGESIFLNVTNTTNKELFIAIENVAKRVIIDDFEA